MTRRGAYGSRGKFTPTTAGTRLKAVRIRFNWTQKDLAALLGVPQQAVSNWETDRSSPVGSVKRTLSHLLGIPWDALETGENFQIPDTPPSMAAEGSLIYEAASRQPVLLPSAAKGEVWLVEAETQTRRKLDPAEAAAEIQKALDAGGSAWLVVRNPISPEASKTKLG